MLLKLFLDDSPKTLKTKDSFRRTQQGFAHLMISVLYFTCHWRDYYTELIYVNWRPFDMLLMMTYVNAPLSPFDCI